MDEKYADCIAQWDDIFLKSRTNVPSCKNSGNEGIDNGIAWVSDGTETILDFGCGNGTMLFLSAFSGTKKHIGIDLSKTAIEKSKERAAKMPVGEYSFIHGSIETLHSISDISVDAVIMSNILDNLYPEDAETLLCEIERILRNNGKLLVKLNSWMTTEEIKECEIDVIKDDLLDDGMLLLNYTTEKWTHIFEQKFDVVKYTDVVFPEYEQTNRMFYMEKHLDDR